MGKVGGGRGWGERRAEAVESGPAEPGHHDEGNHHGSEAKGESRLLDGTCVIVSGVGSASGDSIQRTISIDGHDMVVDAEGLVAVRLNRQRGIEALAAGGLKSLHAGDVKIDLAERVDVALWRDSQGRFHGVLQDCAGPVPEPLAKLTDDWLRLAVPVPIK